MFVHRTEGRRRWDGHGAWCIAVPEAISCWMTAVSSRSFTRLRTLQTPPSVLWTRTRLPFVVVFRSSSSACPHGHIFDVLYSSRRIVKPRTAINLSSFFLGMDGLPLSVHLNCPSAKNTILRLVPSRLSLRIWHSLSRRTFRSSMLNCAYFISL